jgi:hypothetical protein
MLQREPSFDQSRFRSHQIDFVKDFTHRNGRQHLSINQLSRAVGCCAGRVKASLENGLNDPKVRGRHFACDDQSEIQILELMRSQAEKSARVTRTDLRHHCEVKYSRSIARDGSILSSCVTKPIYLNRNILPKKMRNWKFPELFWMIR